jgi:hypothetical protein
MKRYMVFSMVENFWLCKQILQCDVKMGLLLHKHLMHEHILSMFGKTMEHFLLLMLGLCLNINITFDL